MLVGGGIFIAKITLFNSTSISIQCSYILLFLQNLYIVMFILFLRFQTGPDWFSLFFLQFLNLEDQSWSRSVQKTEPDQTSKHY